EDKSGKIILSHTAAPLKDSEKEIGSEATFGTVDVLIPCSQSYSRRYAFEYLHSYFPEIPLGQIRILLNNSIIDFNPGTILQKEGDPILNVYLVLTGNVEMIQSKLGIHHAVSSGELVGEIPIMIDESSYVTFRAVSFVQALKIPRAMFLQFIKNNGLHEGMKKLQEARRFLRNTPLFGEALSYPVQNSVARSMSLNRFEKKTEIGFDDATFLYVIKSGELECYIGNDVFETLKSGDFFGQERAIFKTQCLFHIRTLTEVEVYQIPGKVLKDIPVVHWKLFEAYEKRLRLLDSTLTGVSLFQWRDEYSVQVHKMDKQHQKLFSIGEKLSSAIDSTNMKPMIERALEFLVDYTKVHLTEEEALMALYNYPELDSHRKKHKKLTEQVLELQAQYKKDSVKLDATFFDFFRDWIITHILAEDRKYSGFLNSKGVH
ncbi:bacteriohemerythrin, partial [bacterium]|nr:bacteriohemerythrin [bacterium]